MHQQFDRLLAALESDDADGRPAIGREVLGEVLARVVFKAPEEISRAEIADPEERRPVDRMTLTPGTVSKAVKVLIERNLLEIGTSSLQRATGRPVLPLRLSSGWTVAGVKVTHHNTRPVAVATVLTALDGTVLRKREPVPLPSPSSPTDDVWPQIARIAKDEIDSIKADDDNTRVREGRAASELLGAGVEVGGHVFEGQVVLSDYSRQSGTAPLAHMLESLLQKPVVVENDVNALAVMATRQRNYGSLDMVVVAVYDEGVGGGLVMDGRVRRGGHGAAMEIGHLPVERQDEVAEHASAATDRDVPGFSDACWCTQFGHVEVLATPSRIRGELGVTDLQAAAATPSVDAEGNHTREYRVFTRAGTGLGRGLAHTITLVNPGRLILKLPPVLIEYSPEKAASAYLTAVKREINTVFSTGAADAELIVEAFDDVLVTGARAAAVCVIDAFIEHLRGLDGCQTPGRRRSDDPTSRKNHGMTAAREDIGAA
ncbi:ROK family protein [Actinosynnema sp. ALI-1.44]|uniref:ROK family protein n=1 Tax=Actinosynnema sp. ALI-1.44 TaxID=1933779 RepID=UPI0011783549|nr:ROK family protein [Actinosynnema sp. ALI-1.44]